MNESYQQPGRWHDVILTPAQRKASAEPSEHIMSFHLHGLQASSVYEAIVQAKNRFGWNEVSPDLTLLTACRLDRFQVNGTIPIQLTRLLIANPCASLSASPGERHFPVLHATKQHRSPCRRSGACRHVNDPQRSVQPLPTRCPVAGPLCRCAVGRAAPAAATDSHDTVGRHFHSIVGCLPPPPLLD